MTIEMSINTSLEKFITDMLNVKLENLQELKSKRYDDGSIEICLELKRNLFECPYCNSRLKIHGYHNRKLNHSTLVNRRCTIIYRQRRYRCDSCELTFREDNPFINTRENVTLETKINVLKDLKYVDSTYTRVAQRYNLSATKVQQIFDKHVNIPRKPLPRILSMDEHYFPESDYNSDYCCLLMDFETGTLVDVLPDRRKPYLSNYFSKIKIESFDYESKKSELDNIQYLSIDCYDNFRSIGHTYFPNALICADSFHVLQNLTKAFRDVRLACRRSTEDDTLKYLLSKFKYVFDHKTKLNNPPRYNKKLKRRVNNGQIRDIMFKHFPRLKTAYELKEAYIIFNETSSRAEAEANLAKQIEDFKKHVAEVKEYENFITTLENWNQEIINSFILVGTTRINNSFIESKNRLLNRLFINANGFKNSKRTRNRILYCLNSDDDFTL